MIEIYAKYSGQEAGSRNFLNQHNNHQCNSLNLGVKMLCEALQSIAYVQTRIAQKYRNDLRGTNPNHLRIN
jgi:hypothetical protein